MWYERSRVFKSKHDYDLAIKHSRKLVPALQNMLEIALIDRHPFYFLAKEHLTSYPEIYRKLEKFEELFNKRVRELLHKHGDKIRTPDSFRIWDPVKVKGKGVFGKLFGETRFVRRDIMHACMRAKIISPTVYSYTVSKELEHNHPRRLH